MAEASGSDRPAAPGRLLDDALFGMGDVVVAVDVGGTSIKAAVIDGRGSIQRRTRYQTPFSPDGSADLVAIVIAQAVTELRAVTGLTPSAVGVVFPGVVDESRGEVVIARNLGIERQNIARLVGPRVSLPTFVTHDVRAAGMAERVLGAAKGYDDTLTVVIGTGVAAAISIGGVPYPGGGYAGEIGHIVVRDDGPLCACGSRGCLEAYASAAAIARRYAAATGSPVAGASEVVAAARRGDEVALSIWQDTVASLARAIDVSLSVLAPEVVVVGGGLSEAGDFLLDPLAAALDRNNDRRTFALRRADFGADSGLVGAGLLGRRGSLDG